MFVFIIITDYYYHYWSFDTLDIHFISSCPSKHILLLNIQSLQLKTKKPYVTLKQINSQIFFIISTTYTYTTYRNLYLIILCN